MVSERYHVRERRSRLKYRQQSLPGPTNTVAVPSSACPLSNPLMQTFHNSKVEVQRAKSGGARLFDFFGGFCSLAALQHSISDGHGNRRGDQKNDENDA